MRKGSSTWQNCLKYNYVGSKHIKSRADHPQCISRCTPDNFATCSERQTTTSTTHEAATNHKIDRIRTEGADTLPIDHSFTAGAAGEETAPVFVPPTPWSSSSSSFPCSGICKLHAITWQWHPPGNHIRNTLLLLLLLPTTAFCWNFRPNIRDLLPLCAQPGIKMFPGGGGLCISPRKPVTESSVIRAISSVCAEQKLICQDPVTTRSSSVFGELKSY